MNVNQSFNSKRVRKCEIWTMFIFGGPPLLCKHCDLNEIGSEQHYLMLCSNTMFRTLRYKFIDDLYKINKSLMLFNTQDLFHYIFAIKDKNILKILSKYCFDILAAFDLLE